MTCGKVFLVGAGPGDPGLLTVRGRDLLRCTPVIVYDQLIHPALLEEAGASALKIFVGKRAGRHCIAQEDINGVLIAYARAGHDVVRLKGGDPFVFGRGGEEAEALAESGIPFEVVPGVSSAIAVPAYAGIPLTHRKFASSFAVVTGHEARTESSSVDWAKLATAADTLVILMGLTNLLVIVERLTEHGRSPDTPAAVIGSGTTGEQESAFGTLADIVEKSAGIEPPATIIVGDVVSLADKLQWFIPKSDHQPLYGSDQEREPAQA
jgi:uroporphyrin-III C-methyltransferase